MHVLANECVEHIKQEHDTSVGFRIGFPRPAPRSNPCTCTAFPRTLTLPQCNLPKHWNSFTREELWVDVRRVAGNIYSGNRMGVSTNAVDMAPKCPHAPTSQSLGEARHRAPSTAPPNKELCLIFPCPFVDQLSMHQQDSPLPRLLEEISLLNTRLHELNVAHYRQVVDAKDSLSRCNAISQICNPEWRDHGNGAAQTPK
ncbi:hypothetical protein BASA81_010159 [Batrachochytrium salamandrivorans]|nr:hypothetical protein BASA81_010159 [Batrachochytrium salamandrivorans]